MLVGGAQLYKDFDMTQVEESILEQNYADPSTSLRIKF